MRRLAFVLALAWLPALACDMGFDVRTCVDLDSIKADSTGTVRVWKTPC